MANQNLTRQEITFACLDTLENNTQIVPNLYRDLDQEFGKAGGKIGDTIFVRKPPRAIVTSGAAYQPQPMIDTEVPITINQQDGVHFGYSTAEKFLNIDDLKRRYLDNYAIALANDLDFKCAVMIAQNTAQFVGTVGTNPGNGATDAFNTYSLANQRIDNQGFKLNAKSRCMFIPTNFRTAFATFAKGFFNPAPAISAIWEKNQISDLFGNRWFVDQNCPTLTIGALGGTPAVVAAGQTGTSININGWTASIGGILNVGDKVSYAGVYAVNPQSRASTGELFSQTVQATAASDNTGAATLSLMPALVPSGQFQNCTGSPAAGALVNVWGTAAAGQGAISGIATPQGFLLEKQSYAFVSFPGDVPDGVDMGYQSVSKKIGVSLRFTRFWWGMDDEWKNRIEVYFGMGPLYMEGACLIAG